MWMRCHPAEALGVHHHWHHHWHCHGVGGQRTLGRNLQMMGGSGVTIHACQCLKYR
jgi:hypothetical protein